MCGGSGRDPLFLIEDCRWCSGSGIYLGFCSLHVVDSGSESPLGHVLVSVITIPCANAEHDDGVHVARRAQRRKVSASLGPQGGSR